MLTGHKTARERFAGANRTWTCEGMMGDGKALQMGTSHELGQNFARPFDITYANAAGTLEYVWQTSWGVSTRLVGALVMAHGDDFGLRLPPALAPVAGGGAGGQGRPRGAARRPTRWSPSCAAAGHRVRLDDRTDTSFGRRSVDWELKGVPVRVEVGPRDLAEGNVTVVTRHRREKENVAAAAPSPARSPPCWRAVGRRPPGGGHGGPRAPGRRTSRSLDEAIEAGSVGFARVRLGALGPDGEDRLAEHAISRPLPAAARRLAGRARATPRTTSWPSSAGRTSAGIAIIPPAVHF